MSEPRRSDGTVVDADTFRRAFRQQASTVAAITVGGSDPTAFTATSVTSVSVAPPTLSFNIARQSSAWPRVETAEYVAVHLLSSKQIEVATILAAPGIRRLEAVTEWDLGPYDLPILRGVTAVLTARLTQRFSVADHVIVVGEVVDAVVHEASPLLYRDGGYLGL